MREEIKIKGGENDRLINSIIEVEWTLFDKVRNIGGRAGCQDREWEFYVNRYSQFSVWNKEMLRSYAADLQNAVSAGRNVITEKYAYMMEYTDPDYYARELAPYIPAVSPEKKAMVLAIAETMTKWEADFQKKYPSIGQESRPLEGSRGDDVSSRLYTVGELQTYSENTLALYAQYLVDALHAGRNLPAEIRARMVEFYGYRDLTDAENKLKQVL